MKKPHWPRLAQAAFESVFTLPGTKENLVPFEKMNRHIRSHYTRIAKAVVKAYNKERLALSAAGEYERSKRRSRRPN